LQNLHSSSSWWGFSASDSVSKASYNVGAAIIPTDQATIVQLIEADETLFNNIRRNPLHIIHPLLPKQTTVTALGPDLIILNLPTIMTSEILLIECSFAIPVALPNI